MVCGVGTLLRLWALGSWSLAYTVSAARLLHSVPEDPFAFPKFRVTFLNGLPVLNETAERWLKDGLRGGPSEFLEVPWEDGSPPSRMEISSGHGHEDTAQTTPPSHRLEYMKMGPNNAYLCLIPPSLEPPEPVTEALAEVTPLHSWSLLQPLSERCLYYRQAWFTYSYCHNKHVRQFREAPHAHPHPPGGFTPEEDRDYEAYTLGLAPKAIASKAAVSKPVESSVELTPAERSALAANLDIAEGAGSRYLVQHWKDGSVCDRTGKRREVEIQFHCSMTVTDTIVLVKETRTCHYTLVVHTPRLCGEPGFQSQLEVEEEALIRCREIVTSAAGWDTSLPEAEQPFKVPRREKPVLPPPPAQTKPAGTTGGKLSNQDALAKALQNLLGQGDIKAGDRTAGFIVEQVTEDGEIILEYIDGADLRDGDGDGDGTQDDGYTFLQGATGTGGPGGQPDALWDILKAAGIDVQDVKRKAQRLNEEQEDEEMQEPDPLDPLSNRDEL